MRDYRFRAKRLDNGEWIYGYLFKIWEEAYILWGTTNGIPNMIEVDPFTVGQYTGLQDKNGKDIYEGDILGKAGYWSQVAEFQRIMPLNRVQYNNSKGVSINGYDGTFWEVIGNIHDNPELLKEGEQE